MPPECIASLAAVQGAGEGDGSYPESYLYFCPSPRSPPCSDCGRVPEKVMDPITATQERLMRKLMDFPQRPAVVLLSFLQV